MEKNQAGSRTSNLINWDISIEVDTANINKYNWHVVYTKPRNEKKVASSLEKEHIEYYLPLKKSLKQWSDRKKWVTEPLIRSYVFVKISEKEYYEILKIPGVVKYVKFEGKAAIIKEKQLTSLKIVVEKGVDMELLTRVYKKGDNITITSGTLKGVSGEIIEVRGNKKFLIRIEPIGYSILLNLQEETIENKPHGFKREQ